MTAVYLATAAVLMLSVAAVRYQRLSVAVPAVIMTVSVAGWNLARAIRGPVDPEPSFVVAANVVLVQICAASFYVACRRLVTGRWSIRGWHWMTVLTIGAVSFVGMLPRVGITDGARYYDSPVFLAHLAYSFALLGAGVLVLSQRQHDSSRHVHHFIVSAEAMGLLLVTTQVAVPSVTPLTAGGLCLLVTWTTGHTGEWSRSASQAGKLIDSIGIFIFVVDRNGVLHDWNGPAASLLNCAARLPPAGLISVRRWGTPNASRTATP